MIPKIAMSYFEYEEQEVIRNIANCDFAYEEQILILIRAKGDFELRK